MITLVQNTTQLTTTLQTARDGDVIKLAAGTYSPLTINGQRFAQGITIESADAGNPAILTGLLVKNASGVDFANLDMRVSPTGGGTQFYVFGSSDVNFRSIEMYGSLDGNPQNDMGGLLIQNSTGVSVTGSQFYELAGGISHIDSGRLTFSDNVVHDVRRWGIRGGGSSDVVIDGNTFRDFRPVLGDHPDAVQFWTTNTTVAAHDIVVTNNSFLRGAGGASQGIFFNDEQGNLPYDNVLISGNLVAGGMYHGITVIHGTDVTITDNIVQGFSDMKSWIRLDVADRVTLANNHANLVTTLPTVKNLMASNNVVVGLATDSGAWALSVWQAMQGAAADGPSGLNLAGDAGADTLTSAAGADTLTGNGGADRLVGGAGDDVYVITSNSTIVEADGGGIDTIRSAVGFNLPGYVENIELTGTKGTDSLGNHVANVMTGNVGANQLAGRGGADTINGGGGADTITGGTDNDLLVGGAGADRFTFAKGDGRDTIRDFGAGGEHDVIDAAALFSAGVTASLTQGAAGVMIAFSSGDSLTLEGVQLTGLQSTATGWVI